MRGLVLTVVLLLAAAWAAALPMGIAVSDEERQSAFAGHELAVARTLAVLKLTPAQQQALMPLLNENVTELATIRTAQVKAQGDVSLAMTGLRSVLLANTGVSEAVRKAVTHAEVPYEGIKKWHDQAASRRAAIVWAMLSTAQGTQLRRLAHTAFGAEGDDAWIKNTAGKLKSAPKNPNGLLNDVYHLYGLSSEEIMRAAPIGWPVMQQWAVLSSQQARGQQQGYLRRLIALPDTGILAPKLDSAMERTINDTLLSGETLHLLDPRTPEPSNEVIESSQLTATLTDIRVLNLVNGLNLTPEQMNSLLTIVGKANGDYQAIAQQRRVLDAPCIMLQQQLRDNYMAGTPLNGTVAAQLSTLGNQLHTLRSQEEYLDSRYAAQVRGILSKDQLTLVADFTPVTVPEQHKTHSEHSNTSEMETALSFIRTLPVDALPQGEVQLNAQITDAFKKKKYHDTQIQAVLYQAPGIVSQARAMDDATFAAKKRALAQVLSVPDKQPVSGKTLDERLVTYLCSPNLGPIFTNRSASVTHPAPLP